jgi:hypothetical protein
MIMTFEQAREEIAAIREADPATYTAMRKEASDSLQAEADEYPEDYGFDIGSSDVSCRVIEMYRCGEMEV